MKYQHLTSLLQLRSIWVGFLCAVSLTANGEDSHFKIELIPTIVWQGQNIHSGMTSEVLAFKKSFPKLKIVHAVNPRLFMNGANEVAKIQEAFGAMMSEDDGVAMHFSRLREWMVFSRIIPTNGDNLYGVVSDHCDELCGMDQSLVGMNTHDLNTMLSTGISEMNRAGFGRPRILVAEQGLLPDNLWDVFSDNGLKVDWSGFNLDVVADRLKAFPVYASNEAIKGNISSLKGDSASSHGRSLDHIRFGVWLEGADLTKIQTVTDAAIKMAKSSGRVVRLPLFINAAAIVHYGALLKEGTSNIYEKVGNAHGTVVAWSGDDNSNWDSKRLKLNKNNNSSNIAATPKETAPEPIKATPVEQPKAPALTSAAKGSTTPEKNPDNDIPNEATGELQDPEIVPSHSREMSH